MPAAVSGSGVGTQAPLAPPAQRALWVHAAPLATSRAPPNDAERCRGADLTEPSKREEEDRERWPRFLELSEPLARSISWRGPAQRLLPKERSSPEGPFQTETQAMAKGAQGTQTPTRGP
ncbi:hypothetical protein AAFF_G00360390 [Aldrovandia affinis]|uniref:Uncharacterized protein n=1 Tax=Aldrovandia affinis TaxID=143900 RepID=A0AAD7WNF2_9TELE|nr:hypothetical protein AAFF_G00360390 [Aldrovandia affinis]